MQNTALKIIKTTAENSGTRDYINRDAQLEPKTGVLFADFVRNTANRKAHRMGLSYTFNYNTLIYHLNKFSTLNNATIFTNSINEEFLDDFIMYCQEQNLRQSYIKQLLSLIKAMAKKAGTYGFSVDSSYDDVTVEDEEPFSVFLSMNEITRIYYFRGLTRKQEHIRDLFVVGCLTALRYSDYSTLTRDNFQGNFIQKKTRKTGKEVMIPIHDYVREIYNKYDGEVSPGLSLQHFNRYIKKICRTIGITDAVTYHYTKGGQLVTKTVEKWQLISSHTARRSAATNMYLTGRMKVYEIMQITGHTTEKSFFRYIRIKLIDAMMQIANDPYYRK